MIKQEPLTCLGAGIFGLTIASLEAESGKDVLCWTRDPNKADQINRGYNPYWDDVQIPAGLRATTDFNEAVGHSPVMLFGVPAKGALEFVRGHEIRDPRTIVSLSKAANFDTSPAKFKTTTELIEEYWGDSHSFAALAGPNLAHDLAKGGWAGSQLGAGSIEEAQQIAEFLRTDRLMLFCTDRLEVLQIVSICKTAYSIAIGMRHACTYKSSELFEIEQHLTGQLMGLCLSEFATISAHRTGSKEVDVYVEAGLAGLGDFIASTNCWDIRAQGRDGLSGRNVKFGFDIGLGESPTELLAKGADTLEGYTGILALHAYSKAHSLRTPVLEMTYRVLQENAPAQIVFGSKNMYKLIEDRFERQLLASA